MFFGDARNERWETSYLAAVKFKEKNGRFPSRSEIDDPEIRLIYSWIMNQNQLYKNGELSSERIEKLKTLGLKLSTDTLNDLWDKRYKELCDYLCKNKKYPVVRDPKTNFDLYQLYRWVLHQRILYKSGKLSPERIDFQHQEKHLMERRLVNDIGKIIDFISKVNLMMNK